MKDNKKIQSVKDKKTGNVKVTPIKTKGHNVKTGTDWYFENVANRTKILPKEEQLRLLNIYHNSADEAEREKAFNTLIETNQRLVVSIAKENKTQGVDLDDLIQEGNMGLMKAIEKFDPSKNSALSTYATWWIKQNITRYIQNTKGTVRIPVEMAKKVFRLRHILTENEKEGLPYPTDKELARKMRCSVSDLKQIQRASTLMETVSIYTPVKNGQANDDSTIEILELLPAYNETPESEFEKAHRLEQLVAELESMFDERTLDILYRRYGIGKYEKAQTLKEIQRAYDISKERIRQIQMSAEMKIRANQRIRDLIER